MKNKLGKRENLKEYHENGELAYEFRVVADSYCWEKTYDNQGIQTSYKYSVGYDWTATYFDDQGRATSYKDSSDTYWKRIYKENGTYEQINL